MKILDADYSVCMAAAHDAGNQNMKKHGRIAWDYDDFICATETFNKLYGGDNESEATE